MLLIPSCAAVEPDLSKWLLNLVLIAASRCGIDSEEKLARWLRMDRAQLHRQLCGDGHFSLPRLVYLPREFWQHFAVLLAAQHGVTREAQAAARMVVALMVGTAKKRQAKAALNDAANGPQEQRTA